MPRGDTPTVTIAVTTYNYGRFLARAIESALAQDYPADALDIVVIDDGSTDSTADVVEPYLDRVRYVHKSNGGLITTVNRAVAEARGEFISLLSADDEYLPHKTRAQVDFLLQHPEVGMVYADLRVVNDEGVELHPSLWQTAGIKPLRGRAFGSLLVKNVVSGGAMMFRASLKEHFHPMPDTAAWEDWYIALRIAAVAEIDYLPEIVYRYRFHGDNMNLGAQGDKMAGLLRQELKFRRSLLVDLRPGLVTVAELMGAWAALNTTVTGLSEQTGEPIDTLVEVSDEQRERSRELTATAEAGDEGMFTLMNAMALDPWNAAAQAALTDRLNAVAPAPAPPPPPPAELEGARGFTTLAFAAELVALPEMLTAYAACFSGADDATLVVLGHDSDIEALGAALDAAGIAGEDGPDMLAISPGAELPQSLAPHVRAVYSRRPQEGALAARPLVDDDGLPALRDMQRAG